MNTKLFYTFLFLFFLLNNPIYSMDYMEEERPTLIIPKSTLLSAFESEGKEFDHEGKRYLIEGISELKGEIGENFKNNGEELVTFTLQSVDDGEWGYYDGGFELKQCINEAGITHTNFEEKEFKGCVLLSIKEKS